MFPPFLYLCFGFLNLLVPALSQGTKTPPPRRPFNYGLPSGYSVERQLGESPLDQVYINSAIIIAMLDLAYEDSRNLTSPVSYPYPSITLNVTGGDATSQYYRQYATYTLYTALETMKSKNDFTASNFTMQNKAGTVAVRVVIAPASAVWQQLIGGSLSSGLSPRSSSGNLFPAILETRQASRVRNDSAQLDKLTPFYASDWYGPASDSADFFLALATTIALVSDLSDKDITINHQRLEPYGYNLNATNVPLQSQVDYLTNRGVLNLCAHAYGELSERLGYGIEPITTFETTLLWTNGTDVIQQHVLRYEGAVKR
ncbi:MAG: hypothetical protein Q9186_007102 [Xanthomendoza sp. 1 TL-2023]